MRHLSAQLPLATPWIAHAHARELAAMSAMLDEQPALARLVQQDLEAGCPKNPRTGRSGLNGDQVLRLLIVRQLTGCSYEALAFHLADSQSYRTFCRLDALAKPPAKSALADAMQRVQPATLARLNAQVVTSRGARQIEPARTVRLDATVVPVAIHPPTDSNLLFDAVRTLDRLLRRLQRDTGFDAYQRHLKAAKRRAMAIHDLRPQAKGAQRQRRAWYRELLALTEATATYATCGLAHLESLPVTPRRRRLRAQLGATLPLVAQVMDQTTRRVLHGEVVPASEKLVSLCEPHADLLVKDGRTTHFGHKIFLTTGRSGLILDCAIPKGNASDARWMVPLVERLTRVVGQVPAQTSADGGFASRENLAALKALGVTDVCFAKKRGLIVQEMVRSQWVYDKLRRFRAGIESGISLLKRVFGLARCVWKGAVGFHAYVRTAVLAANLLLLARQRLT